MLWYWLAKFLWKFKKFHDAWDMVLSERLGMSMYL